MRGPIREVSDVSELVRPLAPGYRGEGEHALWHYSEDPGITVFQPHRAKTAIDEGEFVWAVDTRHAPLFWFPRDCPRGCAWVTERTSREDMERFFGDTDARRIHVMEDAWLARMQACRLYAYRLPGETFRPHATVGGYWVSEETVEPLELVECGDLLRKHADAGIELRIAPSIWPWWYGIIRSTVEFSGARLRNTTVPEPPGLRP